jgi:putative hydrolase of the HAD superfamily
MEAVLFDLFGTLVAPYRRDLHLGTLDRVAAAVGVGFEELLEGWERTWEPRATGGYRSIADNVRDLVPTATDGELEEAQRVYRSFTAETLVPKPGAIDVLDWLAGSGVARGLVTNCAPDVPEIWPETRWAGRFDATVFSCELGVKKPAPSTYEAALERLGARPERTAFVGDGSDRELEGAAAVGLLPVLVRNERPGGGRSSVSPGVAVAVVDHLSDLPSVLEAL